MLKVYFISYKALINQSSFYGNTKIFPRNSLAGVIFILTIGDIPDNGSYKIYNKITSLIVLHCAVKFKLIYPSLIKHID